MMSAGNLKTGYAQTVAPGLGLTLQCLALPRGERAVIPVEVNEKVEFVINLRLRRP